jgi:hypothetical protein
MTNVQQDVRDIMARMRVRMNEGITDEVARALFKAWKNCKALGCLDTLVSVFRRPFVGPLSDCI